MSNMLSVGDVAKQIGARPTDISQLFYRRELRDDLCPLVCGRRVIPMDYVDMIKMALRRRGYPLNEPARTGGAV